MSDNYDYESIQRPITTIRFANRNAVIEECARAVDECHIPDYYRNLAVAAIRALKDKP